MKTGLTQGQLAELLDVTQSYISKLESEEVVSPAAMLKVKKALKDFPDRWKPEARKRERKS